MLQGAGSLILFKNKLGGCLISALLLVILFTISGCAGKPTIKVEELDIPIPKSWMTSFPVNKGVTGQWWLSFQDTVLIKYLDQLNNESPTIKTLIENGNLARYNAQISSASKFPAINLNARLDTNVQNLSGFGFASSLLSEDSSSSDSESNGNNIVSFGNTSASLGLNLQWEIDIWGRLINGRKAAYKDFDALRYDLIYLQFSTSVKAAQLYFKGKESAAQLALSKDSYNSLVEIRDLVKDRYEKGLRPSLDYRLAETSVATSIVTIENKKNQLKSINRQLEILIGHYPSGDFIQVGGMPKTLPDVPTEIPANLLERRPDIQSLISKMESNNYRIAESRRNLLPGISLNGSAGTSAQSIEDVLNKDYGVWNLGLNVTAPIFNGKRLRSLVKVQEATFEKSKQGLIKGVLRAFSEVEQLLESSESLVIQINALEIALKQSRDAYSLSKERYDSGVTPLESVLNSQRQYNNIKSQFITMQRLVIENRLSLILALGGDTSKKQNYNNK